MTTNTSQASNTIGFIFDLFLAGLNAARGSQELQNIGLVQMIAMRKVTEAGDGTLHIGDPD